METVTVEIRFVSDSTAARKLEAQLIKEYSRRIDGGTLYNLNRNTELAYREEIVELRKAGWSLREIAEHLDIQRSSVSDVAQRAGYGGRIASPEGPRRKEPPNTTIPPQPKHVGRPLWPRRNPT